VTTAQQQPLDKADIEQLMEREIPFPLIKELQNGSFAVAVSGGADSMALAWLLDQWRVTDSEMHILTVDHGLRNESAQEVKMVASFAKNLGVKCKKFNWIPDEDQKSIQEAARAARYEMMAEYCKKKNIKYLFLAHHADDQFETFLFRLAKGSGPDGLACMKSIQKYSEHLTLVRPLLSVTHSALVETCRLKKIVWVEDPSNMSGKYMRGRMRASKKALEQEGLTPKRIGSLVGRLQKNREVLDSLLAEKFEQIIKHSDDGHSEIKWEELINAHEELICRVIGHVISHLSPNRKYPARLEDIERLALKIKREKEGFKGATLGGVQFKYKKRLAVLLALKESGK